MFRSIQFVDDQHGRSVAWPYSDSFMPTLVSKLFSTDDGGKTWNSGDWMHLIAHDLFFTDVQTGWAVGSSSQILHTADGGETWNQQKLDTAAILETVYFADSQTGWAAGRSGMILHTTNAGEDWKVQSSGTSNRLFSINFADEKTGWAVGDGTILHTSDGGETWEKQESGFGKRLYSIHACRPDLAWVIGAEGVILHYGKKPTSIDDEDGTGYRQIKLHQNYPNPFNLKTEITSEIPVQDKVRLALYDNLGRKVAVLFDGVRNVGLHRITIDGTGLASGVYLYQLDTGGQTLNRKMLIVK